MTTPDKQANQEQTDNPSAKYNFGLQSYQLIELVVQNGMPFEAQAYIEGKGMVLITNQGTIKNEPKIKDGVNLRVLPDTVIYFDLDTFSRIIPDKNHTYAKLRNPGQSIPPPITYAQRLTRGDITAIMRDKEKK